MFFVILPPPYANVLQGRAGQNATYITCLQGDGEDPNCSDSVSFSLEYISMHEYVPNFVTVEFVCNVCSLIWPIPKRLWCALTGQNTGAKIQSSPIDTLFCKRRTFFSASTSHPHVQPDAIYLSTSCLQVPTDHLFYMGVPQDNCANKTKPLHWWLHYQYFQEVCQN
jgi:hypothetical protein